MHEVSLGGMLADYLTGETRQRTTYEDLRQALARYLVEERGFSPNRLRPRYDIVYRTRDGEETRQADIALFSEAGALCLLLIFCPGQIRTYAREATAMARLALPSPCPLVVVTDTREAEFFAARNGEILARSLGALPSQAEMERLAALHAHPVLSEEQRNRESRILHAYTGFLKNCRDAPCSL